VNASELENKIFYAIKFIVRPWAIPDQIVIDAAAAAMREIVRYQKSHHQGASMKEAHHQNDHERVCDPARQGIPGEA